MSELVRTTRDGGVYRCVGQVARFEIEPHLAKTWERSGVLAVLDLEGDGGETRGLLLDDGTVQVVNPAPGRRGSGQRFAACVSKIRKRPDVRDPRALCASIGRHKYGSRGMAELSASRRRGNPESEAAALAEEWYGRPAETVTRHDDEIHYHKYLTDLGRLVELEVVPWSERSKRQVVPLRFAEAENVRLGANEAKTQLFIVGDVQLNGRTLERLGVPENQWGRESIVLGEVGLVAYHAAKHTNAHKPATYGHEFGEEGGELPVLVWHQRGHELRLEGGSYTVERPGIIN